MGQIKHVKRIYKLTNNKNELVRSEAQSALVSFYGFSGLRFLNIVTHPISNWQQIQLLNKLKDASVKNFEHHKKWLQSPVESVKVFALKLATCYSCHDMYFHVIECLHSTSMQVQLSALAYLKKMPREDTAAEVVTSFSVGNKMYKIAVLEALGSIANEREISFLFQQLHNNDVDLKMAAANALSCLHTSGTIFLKANLFADGNPWKNSLLHLKKEIVA